MCWTTGSSSIRERPRNLPPTRRGSGRSPAPAPRSGHGPERAALRTACWRLRRGLSRNALCRYNWKMAKSNFTIGATAVATIAVAFVGLLAFQKIHALRQQNPLRIVFEGSASGLRKGGGVNFDGVQIGEIKSLKLDNPRKIVAFVMV